MPAARHQFGNVLNQPVPVAQQVEHHHRHQQQADQPGDQRHAAGGDNLQQHSGNVAGGLPVFGKGLLQPGSVEIQLDAEMLQQQRFDAAAQGIDISRQALGDQQQFLLQQRQHDQQHQQECTSQHQHDQQGSAGP